MLSRSGLKTGFDSRRPSFYINSDMEISPYLAERGLLAPPHPDQGSSRRRSRNVSQCPRAVHSRGHRSSRRLPHGPPRCREAGSGWRLVRMPLQARRRKCPSAWPLLKPAPPKQSDRDPPERQGAEIPIDVGPLRSQDLAQAKPGEEKQPEHVARVVVVFGFDDGQQPGHLHRSHETPSLALGEPDDAHGWIGQLPRDFARGAAPVEHLAHHPLRSSSPQWDCGCRGARSVNNLSGRTLYDWALHSMVEYSKSGDSNFKPAVTTFSPRDS